MATLDEDSRWKGHHLYGDDYFDPKNDPPLLVIHVTEPLKEEFDYDIVEERRLSFEIILREMADHHQIVIAPLFRRFVEVPLNVNVFPSDFNINSYTARRKSTVTPRDQPKHQSISKKAPPPPPPSSQSSVNQLDSEQQVTVIIPPPPQQQTVKTASPQPPVEAVSPVSPQQPQTSIPVRTQQEQPSPVSPVKRNSQSQLEQQPVPEVVDPNTPVIILSPTTAQQSQQQFSQQQQQAQPTVPHQQQPVDVSTFIEEMRMQHQNRQSLKSNPTSPVVQVSEPVKELDEDVIEVRQVPLPPKRKSQERTSSPQYENSKTDARRFTEEESTDYSTNFRPMVEEDEAVDQTEGDNNFNMAMLNLGAQPIRVQARMSTGALHTPYHQIKRDSITSKLADIDPEQQVQEILRQIKGESNVE
ncbi:predicted protein [Naegleria gruberi]|uniref:Predicted protein n=1 Tax=Naegleria gruberi TaxID=5762 RepID=D2VU67_NAEGR|nr:uncharacterized protein NAEGRDRAFT_52276 [Naegleria gruberi]EFC39579.1 predicted protein [Naegleria gruberi]|eukprot:XP_002672323.1 predicted protein [Naegleria gruberi strain NEG-M]